PPEAGGIADTLHAAVGGRLDVDGHAADLTMDRAPHRGQQRIARARRRGPSGRRAALLGPGHFSRALARHPVRLLGAAWDVETLTPRGILVKSGTLGRHARAPRRP